MKKLLILLALIPFISYAKGPTMAELAKHPRWLRLVHYKARFLISGQKSFADSAKFFLSPNGKFDPQAELEATVAAFKDPNKIKKYPWHPQCAFPARLKFVKEQLHLKLPHVKCEDFDWWLGRIDAKSISLVFSSYYAGNPASMFGHTLLKFNSDKKQGKISDFSLNFAADTGPEKGILYIVKGIFGGYEGKFSTEPYYNKVNDYAQGESRDLWEYNLDLNNDQIDWILRHIWELKTNSFFEYYFFDENCSYMLLTIIEAGRPEWNLSYGFRFYALPVDTIKRIKDVNGIRSTYYRPSYRKQMMARYKRLSPAQKEDFEKLREKKIKPKSVNQAIVLEAYNSFLRYRRFEDGADLDFVKKVKKEMRGVLIARAKLGGKTPSVLEDITKENITNAPTDSHNSFTLDLGLGKSRQFGIFEEFRFRFAIHDILSKETGLPEFSNLNFVSFRTRYYSQIKKFRLDRINVIDMATLPHFDLLTKTISWGMRLQAITPHDFNNDHSLIFSGRPIVGLSRHLLNKKLNIHSLFVGDIQYGDILPMHNSRISLGGRLGAVLIMGAKNKLLLEGTYLYDVMNNFDKQGRYEIESGLSHSFNQSFDLKMTYLKLSSTQNGWKDQEESKLSLNYFF